MTPFGTGSWFGQYDGTNTPTITYIPWGGSTGAANIQSVKVDVKYTAEVKDINDANGKPIGFTKIRGMRTLTGTFVVRAAASGGLAAAVAALVLPKDMQVITLAKFIKNADTFLNGDWVYKSDATLGISDEGEGQITIEMMQYFDSAGTLITASSLLAAVS